MLGLNALIPAIACSPNQDPDGIEACEYCAAQGNSSVVCTLNIADEIEHQEKVACVQPNQSQQQACEVACSAHTDEDNGQACEGLVGAPDSFLCGGTSYETEGLPPPTSGGDGVDETTASEPVWEPNAYAHYDDTQDAYIIEQTFVDAIKQNPALLVLDGVSLSQREGVRGFQFEGISTGSLIALLGFQNGDIPLSINGFDVTSFDGVIRARSALDTATTLKVTFSRSGSTQTAMFLIQ